MGHLFWWLAHEWWFWPILVGVVVILILEAPQALTETNFPSGGDAWPSSSSPQHSTEPFALSPHVWSARR